MIIIKKINKFFSKLFSVIVDSIRPMLGTRGVCIYHVTCRTYAKVTFAQKPIYKSIPLIILRLLSCNPITALFFRLKSR